MSLNFPNNPIVDQEFPSPAVPGVPIWTWDGEKWLPTGGGGAIATVYVGTSAPSGALENSLWWDSSNGSLSIFYGGQWIEIANGGALAWTP